MGGQRGLGRGETLDDDVPVLRRVSAAERLRVQEIAAARLRFLHLEGSVCAVCLWCVCVCACECVCVCVCVQCVCMCVFV